MLPGLGSGLGPGLGAAGGMTYRAIDDVADIPERFWQDGGDFSDSLEHGVLATAPGEQARYKDVRVNVDDIVAHWQPPASLFEHGRLSLDEALARLLPEPEDQPRWLLTNPSVKATGLDATGAEVRIDFDRPLVVDRDNNALRTEDQRLAWSAVMLDFAPPQEAPAAAPGGAAAKPGIDRLRAVLDAIRADRKRLKRADFVAMVRELIDRRARLEAIDSLWRELAPAEWREQGPGSPPAGLMVKDWKSYLSPT